MPTRPSVLSTCDVLVCLGAGGVGKTTTAAALGIAAAEAGRRTVVLTVDPARRLADALGLESVDGDDPERPHLGDASSLGNDPRQIEGPWPGQLWAVMLDPRATFDELIRAEARSPEQAERVIGNRLYRNLTTTLSGTNEYMATERLRSLHLDERFDLVIVDTPPSRHAIDLLDSPGRLTRFVDHRLYRSILAPRRGLMRVVNAATQMAVRTISRVVGAALIADVVDFFAGFEGMDAGFRARAAEVDQLLRATTTGYVLVSAARETALAESTWTAERMRERGLDVRTLVINRLTPDFGPPPDSPDPVRSALDENLAQIHELRSSETDLVVRLIDALDGAHSLLEVVEVAEQADPVSDVDGLQRVSEELMLVRSS